MTVLTETTKLNRINQAFGKLIGEYVSENKAGLAADVAIVFKALPEHSKVRLFDILTEAK